MEINKTGAHLVITVHGIRTFGTWQSRLQDLVLRHEPGVQFRHYGYGYFDAIAYLILPIRWIATRRFRKHLTHTLERGNWERVDIVAHSFGTWLAGFALHGLTRSSRPQIHTLILAGSVLSSNFRWNELVPAVARRIINDCGTRDAILLLNTLIPLSGMAGRFGFNGMYSSESFVNRFFRFGHSGYFLKDGIPSDEFMTQNWLPLLLTEYAPDTVDQRSPLTWKHGIFLFFMNWAEPLKIALWLTPLLVLLVWINAQRMAAIDARQEAIRQRNHAIQSEREAHRQERIARNEADIAEQRRKIAVARQLAAQSTNTFDEQPNEANTSIALAVQAESRFSFTGAHQTLLDQLRLFPSSLQTFKVKDPSPVLTTHLAISPHGDLAAVGALCTVSIVSIKTGRLIGSFATQETAQLAFSANGDLLFASSGSKVVAWRIASSRITAEREFGDRITALGYSPEASQLAAATLDGTIHLLSADALENDHAVQNKVPCGSLTFSPTGRFLVASQGARFVAGAYSVHLWNTETLEQIASLQHPADAPVAAFSPDERLIATGGSMSFSTGTFDNSVRIWESGSGRLLLRLPGSSRRRPLRSVGISALRFTSATELISGSMDGVVQVWDLANGEQKLSFVQGDKITGLDSVSGVICSGSVDGTVRAWDARTGEELVRVGFPSSVLNMALARDGFEVAGVDLQGSLITARLPSVLPVKQFEILDTTWAIHSDSSTTVELADSNEGDQPPFHYSFKIMDVRGLSTKAIITRPVRLWGAKILDKSTMLGVEDGQFCRLTGSKGPFCFPVNKGEQLLDATLASGLVLTRNEVNGKVLFVRSLKDGHITAKVPHNSSISSAVFDRCGKEFVTATNRDVQTFDSRTGFRRRALHQNERVERALLSNAGSLLATTGGSKATIWDARTGTRRFDVEHTGIVGSVVFSQDDRVFATIGAISTALNRDRSAKIWNSITGELVESIPCGSVGCVTAAFSDNDRLFVTFEDHQTKIWPWRPRDLVKLACTHAHLNVVIAQWPKYAPGEKYAAVCRTN